MVGGWTKDFAMKPLYNIMEGIWMDKENIELLKSFLTPFHFQRGLEPEFIIYIVLSKQAKLTVIPRILCWFILFSLTTYTLVLSCCFSLLEA